jgi:hypothetical protein
MRVSDLVLVLGLVALLSLGCTKDGTNGAASSHRASGTNKLSKRQKLSLQAMGTNIYAAMRASKLKWGKYPSKYVIQKNPDPEEGFMNIMSKPKLEGEDVKIEVVEWGESGKVLLTWKGAQLEVLQTGRIKIVNDKIATSPD